MTPFSRVEKSGFFNPWRWRPYFPSTCRNVFTYYTRQHFKRP